MGGTIDLIGVIAERVRAAAQRLHRDSEGQTLLEYGLILAFVSTAAISVLSVGGLGDALVAYVEALAEAVP